MTLEIFLGIAVVCLVIFAVLSAFGADDHHTGITGGDMHDGDGIATSDVLTLRNLLLFGIGFGAAGALARFLGLNPWFASGAGLLMGAVLVAIAVAFYRSIRKQESNSVTSAQSLVGKHATVTTAIPPGGYGEITTQNDLGTTVNLDAVSSSGLIPAGSLVEIKSVTGTRASVVLVQ